ncbi:MAG TPA: ABC transporter permease [Puia sp.]|jgi:ABC-type antimicrobial peptide transport system permease subunit|nr:ABC transporter permease [Puia sp.]
MFLNYFKVAWRNLLHNKVYSLLNVFGLALGMGVALLIGLWVYVQVSYDRWLPGSDRAARVMLRSRVNGDLAVSPATALPLVDVVKKEVPGIQYAAVTDWMGPHSLVAGEHKLYLSGAMASPEFLQIFRYPLVKGNAGEVLKGMYSIVLTETTAKGLFGSRDPIGKTVRISNAQDLTVTGVLKDLPNNTSFGFNYIVPFAFNESQFAWVKKDLTNWRDRSFQTFVSLAPNVTFAQVAAPLQTILKKYNSVDFAVTHDELFLQPMSHWHLYADFEHGREAGGFVEYVRLFSLIGALVLLIACINFTNLSTARSEKRAREVGVRKAIGSLRVHLVMQFLIESLVITMLASGLALLLVQLALPAFNAMAHDEVRIPYDNWAFWAVMAAYVLLTGLLAGSRPAFYLSGFRPVKVLKGAVQAGRGATLPRKVLVVLQFTCSVALITSTVIIYRQIRYAKDRPTGYDANRLMMTDASNDLNKNFDALKHDLLQSGLVTSVTRSSTPATDIWASQRIDDWQGKLPGEALEMPTVAVCDADYFKTIGMTMKEGVGFSGNLAKDSLNVVLNEAAVRRLRYTEAIGQVITWHDIPQRVHVIGVVKDALMTSPFDPAEPTIFIYDPGWTNIVLYRLSPTVSTQQALTKLTAIFDRYNPSYPFGYSWVTDSYAGKFALVTLIGTLSGLFAILAVLISCLGLFGLAAYMAEQRTKEIGIRKVLGASVGQVWVLLSREYLILVGISCAIAAALSWYFMQGWLLRYKYRIDIGYGVFLLSSGLALAITVLTISTQSVRAAMTKPVTSLRSE